MVTPPVVGTESPPWHRRLRSEQLRYLVVGGWNTGFAYIVFASLHLLLPLHYLVVLVISHVVGTLNAFLTYRYIVFRVRGQFLRDLGCFVLVYLGTFVFNLVALPVLVEGAGLDVLLVQSFVVVVAVVSSYLGHKHFSFKRPST